jgi:hypothetical protein
MLSRSTGNPCNALYNKPQILVSSGFRHFSSNTRTFNFSPTPYTARHSAGLIFNFAALPPAQRPYTSHILAIYQKSPAICMTGLNIYDVAAISV